MTIYLKTANEAELLTALDTAGWTQEIELFTENEESVVETRVNEYTSTHSLDIIGVIHKETGNMITVEATDDMPEMEYPETAPIDGWYANLLLHGEALPEAFAGFVIETPANPVRKFA